MGTIFREQWSDCLRILAILVRLSVKQEVMTRKLQGKSKHFVFLYMVTVVCLQAYMFVGCCRVCSVFKSGWLK